jgi:TP901 family phage tail tape measure protein
VADRNLRIRMLLEASDRVTRPLRDIAGGSTRAGQALKITRDRLKEIGRAQQDVGDFRELKAGLRTTEQAMQAAQTRVGQLAREMQATDSPTKKLAADFARAKREAQQLGQQHESESRRLQELRDRLRAAGVATNDLARHERDLRQQARATNEELAEQERRLQAATGRSQRMARARDGFGRVQGAAVGLAASGASGIATGMALGRPLIAAIGDAQTYESVMTDIGQKADLSREASAQMGRNLLVAASKANQLPEALQQGVDVLAGFGLDPRQAVEMMTPIGRAATAYKAEIADLASASFAAHDNLKVPLEDTARMIDVMAQAGKSGAFEVKDMAAYFPTLTAAYQGLGQTGVAAGGDLSAALQIVRKGAGDSATAAGNLNNILQKITSPATVRAFKKMGVDLPNSLKKLYAEGKTPIEAISELTNKTLKGDLSKLGYLFEDAQVQQGLRPLIQNMEEYRRIRAEAMGAKGTTDTDFADRLNDSAEKTKRWTITSQRLSRTLGGMLMPTINALSDRASAFLERANAWAEANPQLAKGAAIAAGVLAALFLVLGGGAIAIAGILAPFAALTFVAGAFNIAMLPMIGIVAAVIAGIALLAGAAYLLYSNWGGISAWFSGLWASVKSISATAWADISTAFDGGLWGVLAMLFRWGGAALGALWSIGSALMPKLWGALSAGVAWGIGAAPGLFGMLMGAIKAVVWNGLLLLPRLAVQFGVNTVRGFVSGMRQMFGFLRGGINGMAQSAVDWFKAKLGIHSPSRVFMALGGHMMTGLANGIGEAEHAPIARLEKLSRRVVGAVSTGLTVPAMAAGTAQAPPSSAGTFSPAALSSVTIQIYPTPQQSPQDIARAVAAELDRRESAAQARNRSSFTRSEGWEE